MSSKKLNQGSQLTEDILVQILYLLPVKPLIRFSSVSKRWYSIILSDTQFAQAQFKLASERKTLTKRLLISTDNQIRSLDSETASFPDCSLKNHTFFPYSKLLGSCNGMLFVDVAGDCQTHKLFLWNPSTRFVRELPNPKFVFAAETTEYDEFGFGHGLGYVSSTDDYKIFIAGVVTNKWFVEMFSAKLNTWKIIEFPGHHSLSFFISITIGLGVLTNEALHWLPAYSFDPDEELTIFAFDLAKEEFREVPCPPLNGNGDDDDNDVKSMAVNVVSGGSGECLCFSFTRRRGGHELIEFWVMKEYGVRESWNVLFIFRTNVLSEWLAGNLSGNDVVFITEGGTILFKLRHMLVRIECHRDGKLVCSRPYNVTDGDRFEVIEYDETLLSAPN